MRIHRRTTANYWHYEEESLPQVLFRNDWEKKRMRNGNLLPGYRVRTKTELNKKKTGLLTYFYFEGKPLTEQEFINGVEADIKEIMKIFNEASNYITHQIEPVKKAVESLTQKDSENYDFSNVRSDLQSIKSTLKEPYSAKFKNSHKFLGNFKEPSFVREDGSFVTYPDSKEVWEKIILFWRNIWDNKENVFMDTSQTGVNKIESLLRELEKSADIMKVFHDKHISDVPYLSFSIPVLGDNKGQIKEDPALAEVLSMAGKEAMVDRSTDIFVNLSTRLYRLRIVMISYLRHVLVYEDEEKKEEPKEESKSNDDNDSWNDDD